MMTMTPTMKRWKLMFGTFLERSSPKKKMCTMWKEEKNASISEKKIWRVEIAEYFLSNIVTFICLPPATIFFFCTLHVSGSARKKIYDSLIDTFHTHPLIHRNILNHLWIRWGMHHIKYNTHRHWLPHYIFLVVKDEKKWNSLFSSEWSNFFSYHETLGKKKKRSIICSNITFPFFFSQTQGIYLRRKSNIYDMKKGEKEKNQPSELSGSLTFFYIIFLEQNPTEVEAGERKKKREEKGWNRSKK